MINLDKKSIDSYVTREHSGKSYYEKIKYLDSLEEKIEDDEDVQNVYHSMEIKNKSKTFLFRITTNSFK